MGHDMSKDISGAKLDLLRAMLAAVGVVGEIDGRRVIRRESVLDLVDRARQLEPVQGIDWRELLSAVMREMPGLVRGDGNAPGHAHDKPGVWNVGNAEAGKPCAWCAAWNAAGKALGQGECAAC